MNAHSEDLRKKIVQALRRGMGKSEAARSFGVSLSSVERYARMADEGRSLAPKKRPGSEPKLDDGARRLLESDVEERPAATLLRRRECLQKVGGAREIVEGRGCEPLYLPPYSPDFDPIEQAFSKVKALLRRAEGRTRAALIEAMGQALWAVTARDTRGFFDHCGYRTLDQLL
jgi:transposase-like protein